MVNEANILAVVFRARAFAFAYAESDLTITRTRGETKRVQADRHAAYKELVRALADLDKQEQTDGNR